MRVPTVADNDIDPAVPVWIDEPTGGYCGRDKTGALVNLNSKQFTAHPSVKKIPGKPPYTGFESRETKPEVAGELQDFHQRMEKAGYPGVPIDQ